MASERITEYLPVEVGSIPDLDTADILKCEDKGAYWKVITNDGKKYEITKLHPTDPPPAPAKEATDGRKRFRSSKRR